MDDFKAVAGGPWTATVMVSGENREVAIERLRDLLVVIDMAVDTQTINPTDPTTESRAVISTPNSRFDESPNLWSPSKLHRWLCTACCYIFEIQEYRLPTCCPRGSNLENAK